MDNISSWLDAYATRRYGNCSSNIHNAWQLLYEGAYKFHWNVNIRSMTGQAPTLNLKPYASLDPGKILQSWQLLTLAVERKEVNFSVGPVKYDVVDIGRQVLVNVFADLYQIHKTIYYSYVEKKNTSIASDLKVIGEAMLSLMEDLDQFLSSDVNFLLGHWISEARLSAPEKSSDELLNLIEFNARNQITMWGPDENINDYASKDWGGLIKDYHYKRWELYLLTILEAVKVGEDVNFITYSDKRKKLEWSWINQTSYYPTSPKGDSVILALSLVAKYSRTDDFLNRNYEVMENTDLAGNNLYGEVKNGFFLWVKTANQLAFFCEINPKCGGFSILSYQTVVVEFKVKASDHKTVSIQGTTLYLRK